MQLWNKGVTETRKLRGDMIFGTYTHVAVFFIQSKSHQKIRRMLSENLASLFCSCVNSGLFSNAEEILSFSKAF